MSRRGRPKSDVNGEIPKASQYKCSVCDFVSKKLHECNRHIWITHQGQALINDHSGREMTNSEKINGFNNAIKILKVLKCTICNKNFKTGLGLRYHMDICGKEDDEIFKECQICGKRLKLHSMQAHIKMMHSQNTASNQTCNQDVIENNSNKRYSAIKALKKFQTLDMDEDESSKSLKKYKSRDEDMDFLVKSDSDDQDDDGFGEKEESETLSDNYHSSSDPECLDDVENRKGFSAKNLDRLTQALLDYIIRDDHTDTVEKKLAKTLQSNSNGLFRCYNPNCPSQFKFRFELENHYRRCFNGCFFFRCSFDECQINKLKFVKINIPIMAHFFTTHQDIIDDNLLEEFRDYFTQFKSSRKSNATNTNIHSHKPDYLKPLIQLYQNNFLQPKVFSCLKPRMDYYQIIRTNFGLSETRKFPKFKSTCSMDRGDNELKKIEPLDSIRIDRNCIMFNVGLCVTCIAWCPLPLSEDAYKLDSSQFDDLLKCETNCPRDQYLAIATSQYENLLQLRQSDQVFLQIWNVGQLSHSGFGVTHQDQARLALNIQMTGCGDILDMTWCPFGSSYQHYEGESSPLLRIGLIAVSTEDGRVRIFSIAHPVQLPGSYDIHNLFEVRPVLILQNRFGRYQNCNSVDWYPHYPYHMIVAAFNDGHISLWKLTDLSSCPNDCSGKHDQIGTDNVILPDDQYSNSKCLPILSVRWINRMMFLATTLTNCLIYHIKYEGLYDQLFSRIPFQKIHLYPLWTNCVLMMDLIFARQASSICMRSLFDDCNNSNDNKFPTLASGLTHFNDMSLSPWMYLLAYTTDNGELYITQMLKKPGGHLKKLKSFLLYSIRLAHISHQELVDSQNQKLTKMKKVLVNETLNLGHSLDNFADEYYFIFDDTKKNRHYCTSISSKPLTKNDLYRYYAITQCSWNPNLSCYSWLFTATKTGICRLNNYPIVNPKQMFL